ncbi:hypothetical protein D3C85_1501200 [compost metagenome]
MKLLGESIYEEIHHVHLRGSLVHLISGMLIRRIRYEGHECHIGKRRHGQEKENCLSAP